MEECESIHNMCDKHLLIGDIGGTNARFALASPDYPGYSKERILKCLDFATAGEAIKHYLSLIGVSTPRVICLAVAGPIVNQSVRFTNNSWFVDAQNLRETFAIDQVRLLNDFEAIAYSIPFLKANDLTPIGSQDPKLSTKEDYTVGVVGPGTGLGVVGLKKFKEHLIPIVGEASHGGFSPETYKQIQILELLRERYDRVSSERLISGPGIENLYWALCRIHGDEPQPLSAANIFEASDAGEPRAVEAVECFFLILGQIAGDIALALGASDGIYIAGGIAKRYANKLINSGFRRGFEQKGRHRTLVECIATQLIIHPEPGLLGAAYCAQVLVKNELEHPLPTA